MVIRMTSSVEVIIQAVSPESTFGSSAAGAASAGAASAAGAAAASAGASMAAGASAVWATALTPAKAMPRPSNREAMSFFMSVIFLVWDAGSERFLAGFAGADANHLFERGDEDLSVADLAGARSAFDGFDDPIDQRVVNGGLDLHLGQEVNDVLGAAVQLGVALLTAEALHFGHGDAL